MMWPFKRKKQSRPQDDVSSVGNILLIIGSITKDQLNEALEIQNQMNGKRDQLGRILFDLSYIEIAELNEALEYQKKLRSASKSDRTIVLAQMHKCNVNKSMKKTQTLTEMLIVNG